METINELFEKINNELGKFEQGYATSCVDVERFLTQLRDKQINYSSDLISQPLKRIELRISSIITSQESPCRNVNGISRVSPEDEKRIEDHYQMFQNELENHEIFKPGIGGHEIEEEWYELSDSDKNTLEELLIDGLSDLLTSVRKMLSSIHRVLPSQNSDIEEKLHITRKSLARMLLFLHEESIFKTLLTKERISEILAPLFGYSHNQLYNDMNYAKFEAREKELIKNRIKGWLDFIRKKTDEI